METHNCASLLLIPVLLFYCSDIYSVIVVETHNCASLQLIPDLLFYCSDIYSVIVVETHNGASLLLCQPGELLFEDSFNFRNCYSFNCYSVYVEIWPITAMTHTAGSFKNDFVVEVILPKIFPDKHYNIFVTP